MVADATEGMILLDVTAGAGAGAFDRDLLERLGHVVCVTVPSTERCVHCWRGGAATISRRRTA